MGTIPALMELSVLRQVFDDPELPRPPVPHGVRGPWWLRSSGRARRAPSCSSSSGPSATAIRGRVTWRCRAAGSTPATPTRRAVAQRETWEEVTLDLAPATLLGQLNDLYGGARPITVSAFGYWLEGPRPELRPNGEVADTLWIPLEELADPARAVAYEYPLRDQGRRSPASPSPATGWCGA